MSLVNALEDFLASTANPDHSRRCAASRRTGPANLGALYAPTRMIFAIPRDAADLPPALAAKQREPDTVAYVCTGMTCSAPMNDLSAVARELALRLTPSPA